MDADNATNIRELDKFLPQFDKGQEIVIASRRVRNGDVDVTFSRTRKIFGKIYIFLSQWLVVSGVTDYNCGFKAFRRQVAKQLFNKQLMNDWSFDTEVIFLASKYGIPIKEIPVNWSHRNGTSKVNPVLDGVKSFLSLLEIRKNDFMGKYSIER
jgi:dolichyl-phosphate beta-glucosyltransferase